MRFVSPIRLLPAPEIAVAKYVHVTIAVKLNMGHGIPSEGFLASLPKNRVNAIIEKNGCIIAHKPPRTVCLYLTLISRATRK